jgi:hypothetical protein
MTLANSISGLFGGGDKTSGLGGLFSNIGTKVNENPNMFLQTGLGILANPNNRAQGALMGLQMAEFAKARKKKEEEEKARRASQRQILKSADGLNRFVDTREQVFPGVQAAGPSAPSGYQYGEGGSLAAIPGGPADLNVLAARKQIPDLVETGTPGSFGGSTKATRTKIQGKLFDAANSLARLNQIDLSFDEKFQTVGTKANQARISAQLKFAPGTVSESDRAERGRFITHSQNAFDNLSITLNELSGAAITPQEFERLKKSLPNPGEGIFDGDDEVAFGSKLGNARDKAKLAIMRYTYFSRNGVTDVNQIAGIVSLDGMKQFIDNRGQQIVADIKAGNPEISDKEAEILADQQLQSEFGGL